MSKNTGHKNCLIYNYYNIWNWEWNEKELKNFKGDLKGKALATHFLIVSNYPIKLFKYSSFPIIHNVYENIINKYFYNINITVVETMENQGKLKNRKRRVDYSA